MSKPRKLNKGFVLTAVFDHEEHALKARKWPGVVEMVGDRTVVFASTDWRFMVKIGDFVTDESLGKVKVTLRFKGKYSEESSQ